MKKLAVLVFLLAVAAIFVVIVGCGGPAQPAAPSTANTANTDAVPPPASGSGEVSSKPASGADVPPADGDWIISCLHAEPKLLNPLLDTADAYCWQITSGHIFESMLERDNDTLELKPMLAESYEVSPDHLTYTFKMRKDAKFSDGRPVTAQDLLFTFNAIRDPKNETADARNYYQSIEKAEALDDYTVKFTCNKPYFKNLDVIGETLVYPKHVYEQGDFNTHPNNRKPVGSGPYVFESWETNQQITLTRNENYWNPAKKPHIVKLVNKIITNEDSAFQVLDRQELDMMGLNAEQWVNRASKPEFEAKFNKHTYWASSGYVGGYSYICWNLRKPQFSDKRVRQALTMLMNREEMLATIYHGLGKVISGPEAWNTPPYNQNVKPWPFDPDGARKLLDDAGWIDTDKDGIRDSNGVSLAFEFMYPSGSSELDQMITVYKEQLDRAGINMTIRPLEWATFIENLTKRSFDAVTLSWAIPANSDPYQVWHSSQTEQGSNYPGFKNAEVDKILDDARTEFDEAKRNALYWRFHEIVHEEQPYTFLFSRQVLAAVDKRYRGVTVYKVGLDKREWWVPTNLQRYK
ncbi:MAG: hypothetical protein HZB26_11285 [Candidatus Hydrogenedentes bacterium]|nr:hypothetical protein [Candidatus Hydrogenedentota bacterium]